MQAGPLIGQFGKVPGYITAAFSDPGSGLTVAVVLNNSAADGSVGGYLAWQLAAIASKAPAADGQEMPEAGLPWTQEQYRDAIAAAAVCAPPAPQ
jgi:D-alanyl-D-alanine carboxypeptidase